MEYHCKKYLKSRILARGHVKLMGSLDPSALLAKVLADSSVGYKTLARVLADVCPGRLLLSLLLVGLVWSI